MNKEQIIKICPIFRNSENLGDADLVSKLIQKGLIVEDAERIVAFMPIAFGRVVINRIGNIKYSDKYKIKENGKEYSFNDEPIYKLSKSLAIENYNTKLIDIEVFNAIATRSHEINALNKALNSGEDINGSEFSITVIFGYKTLGKRKRFFSGIFR